MSNKDIKKLLASKRKIMKEKTKHGKKNLINGSRNIKKLLSNKRKLMKKKTKHGKKNLNNGIRNRLD